MPQPANRDFTCCCAFASRKGVPGVKEKRTALFERLGVIHSDLVIVVILLFKGKIRWNPDSCFILALLQVACPEDAEDWLKVLRVTFTPSPPSAQFRRPGQATNPLMHCPPLFSVVPSPERQDPMTQ